MLVFLLFALASSQVYNVLDYGAKGDGETNNTKALQTVIDTIEKAGGGVMLFPQNSGKFLSGSLFLTSNITVRIERGAALYGSRDHDDYPWIYSRAGGTMEFVQASLINGGYCLNLTLPLVYEQGDNCNQWRKLKNVTITGGGIIDGQGDAWWDNTTETRPTLLGLLWVDGLVITNLTIQNSPFWNVHPTFCNNVIASHLNITAPSDSPNTDGIDPDSTSNMHIHDCIIDVGDDCIAVKSGKDLNGRAVGIPTANITIERMQYLHGHGVSIGSEMSGGVRNVTFRDSVCNGTQRAVRVKTCRGRGGTVEDIFYYNFSIASVDMAVSVNMYYCDSPPTNASATPIFRNILTKNLTAAVTSQAGEFLCLPESPCAGINMTDVVVQKYSDNWDCEYAYGSVKNVTPPLTCLLPSSLEKSAVETTAVF